MGISNALLQPAPIIYGWSMESSYLPQKIRKKVLSRDHYECQYCGSSNDLCVGHKVPRCRGGDDSISNLEAICRKCSRKKGKLTRDEFLEELSAPSLKENLDFQQEEKKEIPIPFEDIGIYVKEGSRQIFTSASTIRKILKIIREEEMQGVNTL